jgi:hypothetical protein
LNTAETNKKMKWTNKRSRIIDALESNAHENQLESMISNLSLLKSDEFSRIKDRLLFMAFKNGSKECAEFLLTKETADYKKLSFNSIDILRKCEYTKMVEVYNLLKLHEDKDNSGNHKVLQKSYLINRLIDPSKVDAKNERVDFLFKSISDGFFTAEEVRTQIESNYKDKPEKKAKFIALYRELTLKELGI